MALCLCTGLYLHTLSKLHETCSTRTTGTLTTRRVLQLRNLYGPPDRPEHENRPLRHDRDDVNVGTRHDLQNRGIDHLVYEQIEIHDGPQQSGPWGSLCATTGKLKAWNQHDLRNRGTDHHVEKQLGSLYGRKESGDFSTSLRSMNRMSMTSDELQLRRLRSFLQCEP